MMNYKRINLFVAMVMVMALATTSLISCGGSDDDDDDDDVVGCEAGKLEQLNLLAGDWTMASITQDEADLVAPLAGAISLSFTIDAEACTANFFSVSGGEYLLTDASNVAFSFVADTDFKRVGLGDVSVKIETLDASNLAISFDYVDPADSRVLKTGTYLISFTK